MRRDNSHDDGMDGFNPVTDLVTCLLALIVAVFAFSVSRIHQQSDQIAEITEKYKNVPENPVSRAEFDKEYQERIKAEQLANTLAAQIEGKMRGELSLQHVRERQRHFLNTLAGRFGASSAGMSQANSTEHHEIRVASGYQKSIPQPPILAAPPAGAVGPTGALKPSTQSGAPFRITALNSVDWQRLRFGDQVLFPANKAELHADGRAVMTELRESIREVIDDIQEIHIEGHADPRTPDRRYFLDNLDLAAKRAMEVYRFLEGSLDPTRILMSATSYGHYMPTNRESGITPFDRSMLISVGASDEKHAPNRRIEIRIVYRLTDSKSAIVPVGTKRD